MTSVKKSYGLPIKHSSPEKRSFKVSSPQAIDLDILTLEADLFKTLNDYREVFDQYVDRYPLIDILQHNKDIVKSYYNGLQSLSEGMELVIKAFAELCKLKQVSV